MKASRQLQQHLLQQLVCCMKTALPTEKTKVLSQLICCQSICACEWKWTQSPCTRVTEHAAIQVSRNTQQKNIKLRIERTSVSSTTYSHCWAFSEKHSLHQQQIRLLSGNILVPKSESKPQECHKLPAWGFCNWAISMSDIHRRKHGQRDLS